MTKSFANDWTEDAAVDESIVACLSPVRVFQNVFLLVHSSPLKFNMEAENQPLEKEMTCGNHHFLGGGFKYFLFSPLSGEDSHFD